MMKYPKDWDRSFSRKPICGVLAVATCAGVTFARATQAIKDNLMPFQKRHGGKTYQEQRENALSSLGVKWRKCDPVPKMNLRRWVHEYSKPGKTYMVMTSGHVVTVRDGFVMDQVEHKFIEDHGSRRCFVRDAVEIENWLVA